VVPTGTVSVVTGEPLTDEIVAFVQSYGYLALFVFVVLETRGSSTSRRRGS
jgi:hypothetical protein